MYIWPQSNMGILPDLKQWCPSVYELEGSCAVNMLRSAVSVTDKHNGH